MIPASMGLRCPGPRRPGVVSRSLRRGACTSPVPAPEGDESRNPPVQADSGRDPHQRIRRRRAWRVRPRPRSRSKTRLLLRIDRHDEARWGCRLIEIALCNDRVAPRKIPVDAWLYQTRLTVTVEEEPAFLPVTDPLLDDLLGEPRRRAAAAESCSTVTGSSSLSAAPARLTGTWPKGARRARSSVDDVVAGERDAAGRRR